MIKVSLSRFAGVLLAVGCISPHVGAQTTNGKGVAGYLNPSTGVFSPIVRRVDAAAVPMVAAASTGTLKYVMTITLKSGISTSTPIVCTGYASVRDSDFSSEVSYTEVKSVAATRSGNSATCTVAIPYAWTLPSAAGSTVGLSYTVSAGTDQASGYRFQQGTLDSITVPATGATTTRNIAVTL